ncbi:MAG: hypothetical protein R3B99_36065 [Polyangiales bacterium]
MTIGTAQNPHVAEMDEAHLRELVRAPTQRVRHHVGAVLVTLKGNHVKPLPSGPGARQQAINVGAISEGTARHPRSIAAAVRSIITIGRSASKEHVAEHDLEHVEPATRCSARLHAEVARQGLAGLLGSAASVRGGARRTRRRDRRGLLQHAVERHGAKDTGQPT